MIYILDAYNVIYKIPRLSSLLDKDLRSAREALAELCSHFASLRGDVTQIVLVFDGKSEFQGLAQASMPKLRIIFSETGEDADERIVKVLERMQEKNRCVVSDDNFVRNHARAYKADVMSVAAFDKLVRGKDVQKKRSSRDSSALSEETARQITEAYKKELGLS